MLTAAGKHTYRIHTACIHTAAAAAYITLLNHRRDVAHRHRDDESILSSKRLRHTVFLSEKLNIKN